MEVRANAKLNLTLDVLDRRPDGYHNMRMIMQSVELADDLLDTIITIRTNEDVIRLATQQKALSDWRMSGLQATQFVGGYKNWHKENLDQTLQDLKKLGAH